MKIRRDGQALFFFYFYFYFIFIYLRSGLVHCQSFLLIVSSFLVAELKTNPSPALPPVSKNKTLSISVGCAKGIDRDDEPALGLSTRGAAL